MRNICLILEYLGSNYSGFQRQKNGLSIQEVLEETIFLTLNEKVKIYPSGRTDAGVHALGQVVNFFCSSKIDALKLSIIINQKLPFDIKIKKSFEVEKTFNSRRDAKTKTYLYKIFFGQNLSVFDRGRVLHYYFLPNLDLLNILAKKFVGEHDFSSFVASKASTKTTIRNVFDAHFEIKGQYLFFYITGNGFLYNMVRIVVGTILDIIRKKKTPDTIDLLFKGSKRSLAGKTVSPDGLYLYEVNY